MSALTRITITEIVNDRKFSIEQQINEDELTPSTAATVLESAWVKAMFELKHEISKHKDGQM